ncbi:hypothetical protein BC833DRAFT_662021 [Globomyces pollinis-pini]|nr:hypothetical protein BC833DRAFT_662021 [Globomyces pollinis-pini]
MTDHLELLPNFWGANHFCKWSEELHKGTTAPILLIDEYDAFLKVCRKNPVFLVQMNRLISHNRNTLGNFSSIVCAGTFSIVATQYDVGDMDVDRDAELKQRALDPLVWPFDIETPWNIMILLLNTVHLLLPTNDLCEDVLEDLLNGGFTNKQETIKIRSNLNCYTTLQHRRPRFLPRQNLQIPHLL